MPLHCDDEAIYTDGSKSNSGCGAAAVYKIKVMKTLSSKYTSLNAELFGIQLALQEIQRVKNSENIYVIFLDCDVAINLMGKWQPNNKPRAI